MNIIKTILWPIRKVYRICRPAQIEMCERWFKLSKRTCVGNESKLAVIRGIRGNFSIYNFHVLVSMMIEYELQGTAYCLDLTIMEENYNMWNAFFESRGESVDNIENYKDVIYTDMNEEYFALHLDAFNVRARHQRAIMSRIYKEFFRLNEKTSKYVEDEFNAILSGKKVLGVLARGTDYTQLKPKNHPVQPSFEQIADECEKRIKKKKYKYIYIATEDKKAVEYFQERFPNCEVLVNKRKYYDNFYADGTTNLTVESFGYGRKHDRELKAVEYISSLVLLSRCDELIAGDCGGSRAAIYLNGGEYKRTYLFDLGRY
ncbi:hypothetical protein [Butyrivibrio sp. INlla14]|uniref:hypothetical protein n=1 Tax=Butyrivibrio sp. INlla14 TaxID=1520808 RepID=UPI0008762F0A|nr:hypothetical protein [Butyrivibrio sp. INlla14]SCY70088.1 hypothetical protein SAMN02910371_03461 [Butyrivibrio sp. INlla14]